MPSGNDISVRLQKNIRNEYICFWSTCIWIFFPDEKIFRLFPMIKHNDKKIGTQLIKRIKFDFQQLLFEKVFFLTKPIFVIQCKSTEWIQKKINLICALVAKIPLPSAWCGIWTSLKTTRKKMPIEILWTRKKFVATKKCHYTLFMPEANLW